MGKEIQSMNTMNLPQWKLIVKENYKEGKSLMVVKMHHTMCDAHGIVSFVGTLDDNADFGSGTTLHRQKGILEKLLMYSTIPFNFIAIVLKVLFLKEDRNPLTP